MHIDCIDIFFLVCVSLWHFKEPLIFFTKIHLQMFLKLLFMYKCFARKGILIWFSPECVIIWFVIPKKGQTSLYGWNIGDQSMIGWSSWFQTTSKAHTTPCISMPLIWQGSFIFYALPKHTRATQRLMKSEMKNQYTYKFIIFNYFVS